LILLPASLLSQWQEELREKGGLISPRLRGNDTFIWPDGSEQPVASLAEALKSDALMVSREFARRQENRAVILAADPCDLVLLDETHAARRKELGQFRLVSIR
jgi:hypothetical protein